MLRLTFSAAANDPARKGQLASRKQTFGPLKRYAIWATHTRFDCVEWFVADTYEIDDLGMPAIVRQGPEPEALLQGLDLSEPVFA